MRSLDQLTLYEIWSLIKDNKTKSSSAKAMGCYSDSLDRHLQQKYNTNFQTLLRHTEQTLANNYPNYKNITKQFSVNNKPYTFGDIYHAIKNYENLTDLKIKLNCNIERIDAFLGPFGTSYEKLNAEKHTDKILNYYSIHDIHRQIITRTSISDVAKYFNVSSLTLWNYLNNCGTSYEELVKLDAQAAKLKLSNYDSVAIYIPAYNVNPVSNQANVPFLNPYIAQQPTLYPQYPQMPFVYNQLPITTTRTSDNQQDNQFTFQATQRAYHSVPNRIEETPSPQPVNKRQKSITTSSAEHYGSYSMTQEHDETPIFVEERPRQKRQSTSDLKQSEAPENFSVILDSLNTFEQIPTDFFNSYDNQDLPPSQIPQRTQNEGQISEEYISNNTPLSTANMDNQEAREWLASIDPSFKSPALPYQMEVPDPYDYVYATGPLAGKFVCKTDYEKITLKNDTDFMLDEYKVLPQIMYNLKQNSEFYVTKNDGTPAVRGQAGVQMRKDFYKCMLVEIDDVKGTVLILPKHKCDQIDRTDKRKMLIVGEGANKRYNRVMTLANYNKHWKQANNPRALTQQTALTNNNNVITQEVDSNQNNNQLKEFDPNNSNATEVESWLSDNPSTLFYQTPPRETNSDMVNIAEPINTIFTYEEINPNDSTYTKSNLI